MAKKWWTPLLNTLTRRASSTIYIVSTRIEIPRNLSHELKGVMQTPAFRAILKATHDLANRQQLSERDAAEQIVRTFRKLDELWGEYLIREGVEKIKGR